MNLRRAIFGAIQYLNPKFSVYPPLELEVKIIDLALTVRSRNMDRPSELILRADARFPLIKLQDKLINV